MILQDEAKRCLQCKKPRCQMHCPINTPIPQIIKLYREGKFKDAGKMLFENNPLSAICAIVCPHEDQCRGNCVLGIKGEPVKFHKIEEELSMEYLNSLKIDKKEKTDKKIAVVGGGPAGITVALDLATKGHDVTIFDAHDKIGGIMRYGIPEFRLSNTIIDKLEEKLLELGVKIRPNIAIGPVITLNQMINDGYDSIFIGTGVWSPIKLGVKGESLGNVQYAIDYLVSPTVNKLGKKVAVIGGGNVAIDAARTAKRIGQAEVTILYRKGEENMPATKDEINDAKEDGINFKFFSAPKELTETGVKLSKTQNVTDENGRVSTKILEGEEEFFDCDSIIIAVSQKPNSNLVLTAKELQTDKKGFILIDENGKTTMDGVFSCGDVVTGGKTVVHAVASAKKVADAMNNYCMRK